MQVTKRIYILEDKATDSFYLYIDTVKVARFGTLYQALYAAKVWDPETQE